MTTKTAYPKYKKIPVAWFPSIPSDWGMNRGKFYFRNHKEINRTMDCDNVLSLTMNGVLHRAELGEGGLLPTSYETFQIFEKDNLVFKLIDLENYKTSRVGIVPERGIMSAAYIRLEKSDKNINSRYFYWLYFNLYLQGIYNFLGMGVRSTLNSWDLLEIPIIIPNRETQQRIADFLDEKTRIIDELVAKKEKLIELLLEKESAIITRTVIKGLDHYPKTKFSGVDWMGNVPKDWNIKKVRRFLINHRQGFYTEDPYTETGIKLLRITDFDKRANVFTTKCPLVNINSNIKEYLLSKGDFVFARTGGAGTFGYINFTENNLAYASYLIRFRFNKSINSDFLRWCFLSKFFQDNIKTRIHGGVNQNVHAEDIKEQFVAIPSSEAEQKEIADFLDRVTTKIAKTISLIELQIDRLKEYRSSLIYSAVTGKIKV